MNDFLKTLEEKTTSWFDRDFVEVLKQNTIESLEELYHVLRNPLADENLKRAALSALMAFSNTVDKRRAVPAIWTTFKSTTNKEVRLHALSTLSVMNSRRYTLELLEVVRNKQEDHTVRIFTLSTLRYADKRAIADLKTIIHDQTENACVRGDAIETSTYVSIDSFFEDYLQLLKDPSPDVRFWACYALASTHQDISPALDAIDHIAAFDHVTPESWGWHVDREALNPLERIYLDKLMGEEHPYGIHMSLISPAPEYFTFSTYYRHWNEDGKYTPKEIPPFTLSIDPDWLMEKLRENWSEIEFNVRQPRPQTYLLDWRLPNLIGGLHRDQYALVVTATDAETLTRFVNWYRSIIPEEHKLYQYDWAGEGDELTFVG